jgi:hypothetical protein
MDWTGCYRYRKASFVLFLCSSLQIGNIEGGYVCGLCDIWPVEVKEGKQAKIQNKSFFLMVR